MTQLRECCAWEYPLCVQCTTAPGSAPLCSCQDAREPFRPVSVTWDAGTLASTGSLSAVVSMDRLLRYFLKQFIRRGAMTFTTASGARFTCGDGTGEPVR